MRNDINSTHNRYPWDQVMEGHGFLWNSKDLPKLKKAAHAWSKRTGVDVSILSSSDLPLVRVVRSEDIKEPIQSQIQSPEENMARVSSRPSSREIDDLIMDFLDKERNKTSDTVNITRWVNPRLSSTPKSNNTIYRRLKIMAEQGWLKEEKNYFGTRSGWKLMMDMPSRVFAPILKEGSEKKTDGMIFKWLRNKRGEAIGCLVGIPAPTLADGFNIGWSLNTREPFDKVRGLQIALGRSNFENAKPVPQSMLREFSNFKSRCSRYFKHKENNV